MNAAEVKKALYRRHPATDQFGGPGPWTCTEEWASIDFLAFSAWSKPHPARARHARIGYEVKVSRSDYRAELLRPGKRAHAVAFCHEFYFATPAGLLKDDEKAYVEPDWEHEDFQRVPCPAGCIRGKRQVPLIGPVEYRHRHWRPLLELVCYACRGRGYAAKSRVEREAPTLWIPNDVGLVEVGPRGCTVVRKAPLREPEGITRDSHLHDLIRWVSWRPDPRHRAARVDAPAKAI